MSNVFQSSIPFDSQRIQAAAVYCSDGRFGQQFDEFLYQGLNLPKYDRLAVPGGAACLAGHFHAYREEEGVINQLKFLVEVHGLQKVILIAHDNCAFYSHRLGISPLQIESQQTEDMQKAIRRVAAISRELEILSFIAQIGHRHEVSFKPVGSDRR